MDNVIPMKVKDICKTYHLEGQTLIWFSAKQLIFLNPAAFPTQYTIVSRIGEPVQVVGGPLSLELIKSMRTADQLTPALLNEPLLINQIGIKDECA